MDRTPATGIQQSELHENAPAGRTLRQEAWLRFKRNRLAVAGLVFIALLLMIAVGMLIIDFCDDGATYNQYVISVVWETGSLLPSASTTCKIDVFRRYRIDKSQSFAPSCQTPYAPGVIPEIPSQYDITLCEVDE